MRRRRGIYMGALEKQYLGPALPNGMMYNESALIPVSLVEQESRDSVWVADRRWELTQASLPTGGKETQNDNTK